MRRLMILNLLIIGTIFSAFAQKTIATYDINENKQTTVIVKDSGKSDKDILNELDLDDYTVGEEVYITAEMWKKMQEEKEKKNEPKINKSSKEEVIAEVIVEKTAERPVRATSGETMSGGSKAKKKKKNKSKKYRMKKPKRRKNTSRRGKMTCYSF